MSSSPNPFQDSQPFEAYDGWDLLAGLNTPGSGLVCRGDTPSGSAATRVDGILHNDGAGDCRPRPQRERDKLALVQLADWDEERAYNEDPPTCIHYSIEWKVTVNSKVVSKDTEQDLVLAPSSYWQSFLQPKLEKLLQRKIARNKRVMADDTTVVMSVTERSERDLTKRFDDTTIDWLVVEKQLVKWGELFRAGKKLRVDMSFNYIEGAPPSTRSSRKGDKRGHSSVTQQMLTLTPRKNLLGSHQYGETFTISCAVRAPHAVRARIAGEIPLERSTIP